MSSVHYRAAVAMDVPILIFDYGIVELGGDIRDGFSVLKIIRTKLENLGMRHFRHEIPNIVVKAEMYGTMLFVHWYDDEMPDEFEVDVEWALRARSSGWFLAIYKNMGTGPQDGGIELKELLDHEDTIVGALKVTAMEIP